MRISDWSSDVCSSDLGTNAGLKRVSAGTEAASYTELLHVRRRFIHKEALRSATALVTNAVLATRDQRIWGEAGTACASDSTKVGAWGDRKSVVSGKSVSVRVDLGGRGLIQTKKT